ncbi:Imm7 family immunity protein [Streptomyces xanthophaeus]
MVDELRLRIARMASPYLLDLRWMNGQPFLHLGGMANHRSSTDVIDLFEHAEAEAGGPVRRLRTSCAARSSWAALVPTVEGGRGRDPPVRARRRRPAEADLRSCEVFAKTGGAGRRPVAADTDLAQAVTVMARAQQLPFPSPRAGSHEQLPLGPPTNAT